MYSTKRASFISRSSVSPSKNYAAQMSSSERQGYAAPQRTFSNSLYGNEQSEQQELGDRRNEESYSTSSEIEGTSKLQGKIRQARNVDEVFEIIVKEHVDFRDIRYQEFAAEYSKQMEDFNRNAIKFEGKMESNALSAQQQYAVFQQKFYSSRARDQKELSEKFESMTRLVRDSHVVEIRNLTAKFRGVVKDQVAKALSEQKKLFEIEHRLLIESQYSLKTTIRKLEEKAEQLQQKLDEREKRLQECYDKILKMNTDSKYKSDDVERFTKIVRERDVQIDSLNRQLKAIEDIMESKKVVEKQLVDKEKVVTSKEELIGEKNKLLAQRESEKVLREQLLGQKEEIIRSLNIDKKGLTEEVSSLRKVIERMKDEEREYRAAQQAQVQAQAVQVNEVQQIDKRESSKFAVHQHTEECQSEKVVVELVRPKRIIEAKAATVVPTTSAAVEVKQNQLVVPKMYKMILPATSNNLELRKLLKSRKEENSMYEGRLKELFSMIKLKEDQIKLLQVEVMGLREESETYLSNIQSLRKGPMNCKYGYSNKRREQSSSFISTDLNDLILDPTMKECSSTMASKQRVCTDHSEDGKYVQSVFLKPGILKGVPLTAPMRYRNVSEDKESVSRVMSPMINQNSSSVSLRSSIWPSVAGAVVSVSATGTLNAIGNGTAIGGALATTPKAGSDPTLNQSRWSFMHSGGMYNLHSTNPEELGSQSNSMDLYKGVLNKAGVVTKAAVSRSNSQSEQNQIMSDMLPKYHQNVTAPSIRGQQSRARSSKNSERDIVSNQRGLKSLDS